MFGKDDYLNYFNQILKIETKMAKDAEWLFGEVENSEAKNLLSKILDDEKKHVKIAEFLISILENS